jgi:peptide/nickel transport system substrate-binding protein
LVVRSWISGAYEVCSASVSESEEMMDTEEKQVVSLTRRDTMKAMLIGGLGAAAGIDVGTTAALAASNDASIVWAKPLETTLYDPHTSILGSSWELLHLVYDGLTALDANMGPIPAIAESWEKPSPTTYIFKLRPTAKFSNGRAVTVDDVIGSLKRLTDPKTGSFFALEMGKIKALSSTSPGSVTVELEEPYAPFLSSLASTMASIIPMKELADGSFDPMKEMLGCGPFKIVSHVQDDHWILERNEYYWRPGFPTFSKLTIRIIPADQSRVAGLRDGSIDIASFEASPDIALLLSGLKEIEIVQNPSTNVFHLVLNAVWDQSPFRNEKLRQAVALCLDRQKIVQVALGGVSEPATVMAPLFKACDAKSLSLYSPDLAKAKKLLAEAGVGPVKFTIAIGPTAVYTAIAQVIKENVAQLGMDADIAVADEGSWIKKIWVENPSTVQASIIWYAGYSDPAMVPLWWNPKLAGFTAGHVPDNPELDADLTLARRLDGNDPARAAALQKLCNKIDEVANVIPLASRIDTVAYRKGKFKSFNTAHLDGYANTLFGIEDSVLSG